MKYIGFIVVFFCCYLVLHGQDDISIRIYDFDDGLSHRNVFKIVQDDQGFIWVATISGLNRFDGYNFLQYKTDSPYKIDYDAISDMILVEEDELLLAHPDFLTQLNIKNNTTKVLPIKEGEYERRQSRVPYNLIETSDDKVWFSSYDERTGETFIQHLSTNKELSTLSKAKGQYPRRAITEYRGDVFVAAHENRIWQLALDGTLKQTYILPVENCEQQKNCRIVDFQEYDDALYVLLSNGQIYKYTVEAGFDALWINQIIPSDFNAVCFFIDGDEGIWLGGVGQLLFFDKKEETLSDYAYEIHEQTKNSCLYRQIIKDKSGVIWVASDFGAIRIIKTDKLFSHYLVGGSEYCSNVFCSTRGMTEDDQGNIYISYYNSLHKLDVRTEALTPLFTDVGFFNRPFGVLYRDSALWTGNGLRIDLESGKIDTLFAEPHLDLGVVVERPNNQLLFGYEYLLCEYDLIEEEIKTSQWDTLKGKISYLHNSQVQNDVWVGTLDNGIYLLRQGREQIAHYNRENSSLPHNKINAIYEDNDAILWVATGDGLWRMDTRTKEAKKYTVEDGLPNDFINGILPQGDTSIWVSTDLGLSRLHKKTATFTNFFVKDGLSANEFNRNSFLLSTTGRMYFGGLNGVNAFYPKNDFGLKKEAKKNVPIILTAISKLDGQSDSLHIWTQGLDTIQELKLKETDAFFAFDFSLGDFREPSLNKYSYWLENYDADWSTGSTVNTVRYNNIPAGDYVFHLKAKSGLDDWNEQQLTIRIKVAKMWYNTWLARGIALAILLGVVYAILRYRFYLLRKRKEDLEALVEKRTTELRAEKQKSEDLLLNILPADLADELKNTGTAKAKRHEIVTVMFSDFEGFSKVAQQLEPEELVDIIDYCFRAFDEITSKYNLEKIKTIGDAYLCVGGLRPDDKSEAIDVINAALEIQAFMDKFIAKQKAGGKQWFRARIGVHTGPVVSGIVGVRKFAYDIWGDTVNIASRMESHGLPSRVNISAATYAYVKDEFQCTYHGDYTELETPVKMYLIEE